MKDIKDISFREDMVLENIKRKMDKIRAQHLQQCRNEKSQTEEEPTDHYIGLYAILVQE